MRGLGEGTLSRKSEESEGDDGERSGADTGGARTVFPEAWHPLDVDRTSGLTYAPGDVWSASAVLEVDLGASC
ncbi:hypothetical protein CDO52_18455 [Nocardiopsis gilva YIM 90087]|uniref:Uncharacterized protein n=1 Tax=Nocardiopsis gilva YIM 90087 TaxID=1235441 RepID=A0A223S8T2_9ACTN|nr:hypothetical protein [Nocardiopsis gilva]ASU84521.1 hypothetical protein CDO52_18455 [Nocardiopsis gilva YIM 90087]